LREKGKPTFEIHVFVALFLFLCYVYFGKANYMTETLPIFILLDCCDGADAGKMPAVNAFMRKFLPALDGLDEAEAIRVAVLAYSDACEWAVWPPAPPAAIVWEDLKGGQRSDLGAALRELSDETMGLQNVYTPIMVLLSDSPPSAGYEAGLAEFMDNPWVRQGYAERLAMPLSSGADMAVLSAFAGGNIVPTGIAALKDKIQEVCERAEYYETVEYYLPILFLIDASGGMQGEKIAMVNTVMAESIRGLIKGNYDADVEDYTGVHIGVLFFSDSCKWMTPCPQKPEEFEWKNISADGAANFGAACAELSAKLAEDEFLRTSDELLTPIIILMLGSEPGGDYKAGLAKLEENAWFKRTLRLAIPIGGEAPLAIMAEFCGSEEHVFERAENAQQLMDSLDFTDLFTNE
jgi:uncharacterized protein YegL